MIEDRPLTQPSHSQNPDTAASKSRLRRIGEGAGLIALAGLVLNGWSVKGSCQGSNEDNILTQRPMQTVLAISVAGDASLLDRFEVDMVNEDGSTKEIAAQKLAAGTTTASVTAPSGMGVKSFLFKGYDRCGDQMIRSSVNSGVNVSSLGFEQGGYSGPDKIDVKLTVPANWAPKCVPTPTPVPTSVATADPSSSPTPQARAVPLVSSMSIAGKRNYYVPNVEVEAKANAVFLQADGQAVSVADLVGRGYALDFELRDAASDAVLASGRRGLEAFDGSHISVALFKNGIPTNGISGYWAVALAGPGQVPVNGKSPVFVLAEPPSQQLSGGRPGLPRVVSTD
jgi:hypothetical protein